jgi:hypothetical protein
MRAAGVPCGQVRTRRRSDSFAGSARTPVRDPHPASPNKFDSIIGLTSTLGGCLKGLLLNLRRLEQASQGLDGAIGNLPGGSLRQQIEHQQVLIRATRRCA